MGLLSREGPVAIRVAVALPVGIAAWLAVGATLGWVYGPAAGWIAAALTYLMWTWAVVIPMDADRTNSHASREDPTRVFTDLVVVLASVASLSGVGVLLAAGPAQGVKSEVAAAIVVVSIAASWFAVHTVFSLHYAHIYYSSDPPGGVDFNQSEPPAYVDFFYLGFTIGMTFQVSDTPLQMRRVRGVALGQAMLSYLFGAVILAITVNLIAGLGNSGH